jgi:hypothetical protein
MQKIIIIGAPRSGTNMLRDVLCSFNKIGTWPCDEINYIWRHGNVSYPSDQIPVSKVTPKIKNYINRKFEQIQKLYDLDIVIEKTCANSLRVPFVDAVVPAAKYIYIYRDGLDATGSAKLCWQAQLDWSYILKKVKYVPKTDLPYYGFRYFYNRLYKLLSKDQRQAFWGPAPDNMKELLISGSLNEVCALQWQACVNEADQAFAKMPKEKVCSVKYEDFVRKPQESLKSILQFISYPANDESLQIAVSRVNDKSIGKGRQQLSQDETSKLESLVIEPLKMYGYI